MDAVQQSDDNARLRQADTEDRGAEFERDDGLLFHVIPDDKLYRMAVRKRRRLWGRMESPAHLVLWELRLSSSPDDSQVV